MPGTTLLVLAGGSARRLGGVDKTALVLGGRSLLDRVLAAAPGPAVVVGPVRPTIRPARFVREEPAGGGPLAALAAGLAAVSTPGVLLLAGDLPFLTAAALQALEAAAHGHDGAMAVDPDGRDQLLLSAWRAQRLRDALPETVDGGALRPVLSGLDAARVRLAGHPPPWWDCDTPQAWDQAVRWVGDGSGAPLA